MKRNKRREGARYMRKEEKQRVKRVRQPLSVLRRAPFVCFDSSAAEYKQAVTWTPRR